MVLFEMFHEFESLVGHLIRCMPQLKRVFIDIAKGSLAEKHSFKNDQNLTIRHISVPRPGAVTFWNQNLQELDSLRTLTLTNPSWHLATPLAFNTVPELNLDDFPCYNLQFLPTVFPFTQLKKITVSTTTWHCTTSALLDIAQAISPSRLTLRSIKVTGEEIWWEQFPAHVDLSSFCALKYISITAASKLFRDPGRSKLTAPTLEYFEFTTTGLPKEKLKNRFRNLIQQYKKSTRLQGIKKILLHRGPHTPCCASCIGPQARSGRGANLTELGLFEGAIREWCSTVSKEAWQESKESLR